jgi:hypothetical protein
MKHNTKYVDLTDLNNEQLMPIQQTQPLEGEIVHYEEPQIPLASIKQLMELVGMLDERRQEVRRIQQSDSPDKFIVKYISLMTVLLACAYGLATYNDMPRGSTWMIFGVGAVVGWLLINGDDNRHSVVGWFKHQASVWLRAHMATVNAQKEVELRKLEVELEKAKEEQERLKAITARNRRELEEQVWRHERPQIVANRLANYSPRLEGYVRSSSESEAAAMVSEATLRTQIDENARRLADLEEEIDFQDQARRRLLHCLGCLYERNPDGSFAFVDKDGYIQRHGLTFKLVWTQRGGLEKRELQQVRDILTMLERTGGGWLIKWDEGRKQYRLNIKRYRTVRSAFSAVDEMVTRELR